MFTDQEWGNVMFSQASVHLTLVEGGGDTPSSMMGGTPFPGPGGGGYPSSQVQVESTNFPGPGGKNARPRSRWKGGTPSQGGGTPPPTCWPGKLGLHHAPHVIPFFLVQVPRKGGGTIQPNSMACTCYAAGGMHLDFQRTEDFLVRFVFICWPRFVRKVACFQVVSVHRKGRRSLSHDALGQ